MGFIPFPRVLVLCEMQSASSRIWTRVAVSISYDDNHYTMGTTYELVFVSPACLVSSYLNGLSDERQVAVKQLLCSRRRPEGSLLNSYYTETLLLFQDYSTLSTICTLYCWVLSNEVSSTIFKVFNMTRPGIEPRSPWPLANTLPSRSMSRSISNILI